MNLNWADPVIILGFWVGPTDKDRVDAGGRYWGKWPGNSRNAGKMRIMCNGSEIAVEKERIMLYTEYMKARELGTLPPQAAGKPWFLEGDHK